MDPYKIPDAPYSLAYAGVTLKSRYGKRTEYETMMAALDYLADHAQHALGLVVDLFCDSKACACYSAACARPKSGCSVEELRAIADWLDAAFRQVGGGHNGIAVESGDNRVNVEPWWCGDDA